MKESYGEGPATHTGPESCGGARKDGGETLTGERAGRVFSRESRLLRSADAVGGSGRPHSTRRARKTGRGSARSRSEEHTSELQSHHDLVCRLLLEKKKTTPRSNNALEYYTQL